MEEAQPNAAEVGEVSALLRAWSEGDRSALGRLTPIVYKELHRLAGQYMRRERAGHSLQTTALVNEAYMRLVDYKRMQWQNRAHFFAVSAQVMRRILVEHSRRRNLKRGGDVKHVSLDETAVMDGGRDGSGGAGRRAERAGADGSAQGAGSGDALFWRAERGRDGRSAQDFGNHGDARLEHRQGVAVSRVDGRDWG